MNGYNTSDKDKTRNDGPIGESEVTDRDLADLLDVLKHQCLSLYQDDSEAKQIMYRKENKRQILLAFKEDDVISGDSLEELHKHYQLDAILRNVFIPRVTVNWNDESSSEAKEKIAKWKCAGRKDLFIVFDWLKSKVNVKRIMGVFVDDLHEEHGEISHSDRAIVECLQGLHIEVWDWRRLDVPTNVIRSAAGEDVRVVYLYCSGLNALKEVYLETYQGREAHETMKQYVVEFKADLEKNFGQVNGDEKALVVDTRPITPTPKRTSGVVSGESKNHDNPDGRVEKEWLACMYNFNDSIWGIKAKSPRQVRVALIDDGVESSYDKLGQSIEKGETWGRQTTFSRWQPQRTYRTNYFNSDYKHGTVMAWCIRQVFQAVRLYVAKLEAQNSPKSKSWRWLKTHEGMKNALKRMQTTDDGCLAVTKFFEKPSLSKAIGSDKKAELKHGFAGLFSPTVTGVNLGGGDQTPNLVDLDIGKSLILQCQLAHVCHGTFTEDGDPATLIVILFIFQPKSNNSRFKQASITMTFSAGTGATEAPEVKKIAPYNEFTVYLSEKTEEVGHAFKPSLEGSAGLAKGTLGYEWQRKSTEQTQERGMISGTSRSMPGGSAKHHKVVWELSENHSTKSGIPSLFQGAILLRRKASAGDPLGEKFSSTLEIKGKVNRRDEIQVVVANLEKRMSGNQDRSEHIFFDPKRSGANVAQNPKRLCDENLDRFARLVTIRDWTDGTWKAEHQRDDDTHSPLREVEVPEQPTTLEPTVQDKPTNSVASGLIAEANYNTVSNPAPSTSTAADKSTESRATKKAPNASPRDISGPPMTSEQRIQELCGETVKVNDRQIVELYQKLDRVRAEATLVRRLWELQQEEQEIMREIARLGSR
ncbi:major intracellular serine protease [Fusarium bulbicola]|nr:major intracellular serine protease [Fusarium bulbicola]